MRKLSSSWTWFYKFVFPSVWLGGFGIGTVTLLVSRSSVLHQDPDFPVLIFPVVFVLGFLLFYFMCMRLKSVALDGADLVISNFRETIRVPLRDVERVSGSLFMHPELLWLTFRSPNRFGSKIVFMAQWRFLSGYTWNPLVKELRGMVQQVRSTGAQRVS